MTAPERLSDTAPWRGWERMAANPSRATVAHIGEDGQCDPDCTGCHYPGNGDDCPSYQSGDAEQPCGVCRAMTPHQRFEAVMNSGAPNLDNVTDPDVIGAYGLEWDRCACGRKIPGDIEQCDECEVAA